MEIKTVSSRMHSLIVLYDMHMNFYLKAIDGISAQDAHNRLNTNANHVAWLAGSLVQERHEMAGLFGIDRAQQAVALFRSHQGIQDGVEYPPLSQFKADWEEISPFLREVFINLKDEKLDASFEMMPGVNMLCFDFIAFMMYREANCIGQIALWRRLLGYPGIKYD